MYFSERLPGQARYSSVLLVQAAAPLYAPVSPALHKMTTRTDVTNPHMFGGNKSKGKSAVWCGDGVTKTTPSPTLFIILPPGCRAEDIGPLFVPLPGCVGWRSVRSMVFVDFHTTAYATAAMRKYQNYTDYPMTDDVYGGAGNQGVGKHREGTEGREVFVGNLSYRTKQVALVQLFGAHGAVERVHMPKNRETGHPRGFAFVRYTTQEGAAAAVAAWGDNGGVVADGAAATLPSNGAEAGSAPKQAQGPPRPPHLETTVATVAAGIVCDGRSLRVTMAGAEEPAAGTDAATSAVAPLGKCLTDENGAPAAPVPVTAAASLDTTACITSAPAASLSPAAPTSKRRGLAIDYDKDDRSKRSRAYEQQRDHEQRVARERFLTPYACAVCDTRAFKVGRGRKLSDLPKRGTDGATAVEEGRGLLVDLRVTVGAVKLLRRKGGVERQHRLCCTKCDVPLVYRPVPLDAPSKYTYVMAGAVVARGGVGSAAADMLLGACGGMGLEGATAAAEEAGAVMAAVASDDAKVAAAACSSGAQHQTTPTSAADAPASSSSSSAAAAAAGELSSS